MCNFGSWVSLIGRLRSFACNTRQYITCEQYIGEKLDENKIPIHYFEIILKSYHEGCRISYLITYSTCLAKAAIETKVAGHQLDFNAKRKALVKIIVLFARPR